MLQRVSGAALAALILFGGCARQAPPPGGPPDRTPPRVVWTVPAADSVGVGQETTIHIGFSEPMDRRTVARAVFISPQPSRDVTYRWRGREVEIRLPEPLRTDRTYLITLGAECADESQNRMAVSYSFAFATGGALNKGEIVGRVLPDEDAGTGQAYVWAYDLQEGQQPNPAAERPGYVTQPGSGGDYRLPRLGTGRYRVFAFFDRDGDRRYTPGKDPIAVPPADVRLTERGERVRLAPLRAALRDTMPPRLLSSRTPDRRHLSLRFDEPVRLPADFSPAATEDRLEILAGYVAVDDSSRIELLTVPQRAGAPYWIRLEGIVDRVGNAISSGERVRVKGDGSADRRRPRVVSIYPPFESLYAAPDAALSVDFSEAMAADTPSGFWVVSDSTVAPEGRFWWMAPNRLRFVPGNPWTPGETYRLQGLPERVVDAAGNAPEAGPTFRFTAALPGDLGRLSGTLAPVEGRAVIEARRLSPPAQVHFFPVAPGDSLYTLAGLIPGRYRVSAFLDGNGDGAWTPGRMLPFSPAEPVTAVADTLEVRARWESVSERRFRLDAWWVVDETTF